MAKSTGARDLKPLLGYGHNWQNFSTAIQKAKIACEENGLAIENHFNASIKMVPIGSGAQRQTEDYQLSRKAIEAMHAPYPEDLPSAPSIRKTIEERRRKMATQKKLKPPPDRQEKLF